MVGCKVALILLILVNFDITIAHNYVKTDQLKKQLQDGFSERRSYLTPEGKAKARQYIKDYFKNCFPGEFLEQKFTSDDELPNSPGVFADGVNYIYILKGKRWGTADDKPIVVGAHYDSQVNTPGVDDNGSGMAAMLEMARFVGHSTCDQLNTAIFVAFDFEEFGLDGSEKFVTEYLKKEFLGKYGIPTSSFQGALILETIFNFNETEHSQSFPPGLEMVFPEAAAIAKQDNYRGNFLTLIHRPEDRTLAEGVMEEWGNKTSKFKILHLELAQSKPRPSDLSEEEHHLWSHMYRSDHYEFWNYGNPGDEGLKALFITDTAEFRGNMQECYHNPCDNMESVSEDDLKFLAKTTGVITEYVIHAISERNDCEVDTNSLDGETCGVGSFQPFGLYLTLCLAFVALCKYFMQ